MAKALKAAGAVGSIGCIISRGAMEGGMEVDFERFERHGVSGGFNG